MGQNMKMSRQCWLNVNELFESTKKRRKGSGRVIGSYYSGAHLKKNVEIKLPVLFRARFDREERLENGKLEWKL
jgi:hypothetical protein